MRALWGWILVYVLGLVVLQLLVYRYLGGEGGAFAEADSAGARHSSGDDNPEREVVRNRTGPVNVGPPTATATAEAYGRSTTDRLCPHCGVENEPDTTFTFCRNCAQRLA